MIAHSHLTRAVSFQDRRLLFVLPVVWRAAPNATTAPEDRPAGRSARFMLGREVQRRSTVYALISLKAYEHTHTRNIHLFSHNRPNTTSHSIRTRSPARR